MTKPDLSPSGYPDLVSDPFIRPAGPPDRLILCGGGSPTTHHEGKSLMTKTEYLYWIYPCVAMATVSGRLSCSVAQ